MPPSSNDRNAIDVAIISARELEHTALRRHLEGVKSVPHPAGTTYEVGTVRGTGQRVALWSGAFGNSSAGIACERAITYFSLKRVLFVGVAGGLKDVELGDVVAAEAVLHYEPAKLTNRGSLPRIDIHHGSSRLLEHARLVARGGRWRRRIPNAQRDPERLAQALVAPIAAGEKVIASRRSATYSFLTDHCSNAVAVEMEGYGFLQAVWNNPGVDALVIRGISDRLQKTPAGDQIWQPRAAAAAAAFAFELLVRTTGRAGVPQRRRMPRPIDTRNPLADHVSQYLGRLQEHVTELPAWFPQGLDFSEVIQAVSVSPAATGDDEDMPSSAPVGARDDPGTTSAAGGSRPLTWSAAVERFRHVLLLGEAGSGKSWALRARAAAGVTDVRDRMRAGDTVEAVALPVLISAQKLEGSLAAADQSAPDRRRAFATALVNAIPDELEVDLGPELKAHLMQRVIDGLPIELLIDGFDEIREEGAHLSRSLRAISKLLSNEGQVLVLTSRPASTPASSQASGFWACQLEPFSEPQQRAFAQAWFRGHSQTAGRVVDWLRARARVYRTPLLVALLCTVVQQGERQLPASTTALWDRVLRRLASSQDRQDAVSEEGETALSRMRLLEEIAGLFIGSNSTLETIPIANLTSTASVWETCGEAGRNVEVLSQLISTGILHQTYREGTACVTFLHSAARDYLIARWISREDRWREVLPRIWAQPEWEPVFAMVGAMVPDPTELLIELRRKFDADPLNVARFVAGSIVADTAPPTDGGAAELRTQIIREMLVTLCSDNEWDRERASIVLASIQDEVVLSSLKALINPAIPTTKLIAALRTLGANQALDDVSTLTDLVGNPAYTDREQQVALEALVASRAVDTRRALGDIAANMQASYTVRATAALHCARQFEDLTPVTRVLAGDDEASQRARRLVAECWAIQGGAATDFDCEISDTYCRAVFAFMAHEYGWKQHLADALPSNRVYVRLIEAYDAAAKRASTDPLYAAAARYMVADGSQPARWKLAELILRSPTPSGIDLWNELLEALPIDRANSAAGFLHQESQTGPPAVAGAVNSALREHRLDTLVERQGQTRNTEKTPPLAAAADADSVRPAQKATTAHSLEAILDLSLPRAERYAILLQNRRRLPTDGAERDMASELTHATACRSATSWVEALPELGPIAETRLASCGYTEELARTRLLWPGRAEEVANAATTLGGRPGLMSARAEAFLLLGRNDEAFVHAMSAIGAAELAGTSPREDTLAVLFAAAGTTQRAAEVWRAVYERAAAGRTAFLQRWLILAGVGGPPEALKLASIADHLRYCDPGVAAMEFLAGNPETAQQILDRAISWFKCRRALWMLDAVQAMRPDDSALCQKIEPARSALRTRAEKLSGSWPTHGPYSQAERGVAREHWHYRDLAASFIKTGDWDAAVRVFRHAVETYPDSPMLRNNLGFCMVPIDMTQAREHLEVAEGLHGRPADVNIANRMLIAHCAGDPAEVIRLAEVWRVTGRHDRTEATMWDIDARWKLIDTCDVSIYIVDLASRAAALNGGHSATKIWQRESDRLDRDD